MDTQQGLETTFGGHRVRLGFNPSELAAVASIKRQTAELINLVERLRGRSREAARLVDLAECSYEVACMMAVKAATTLAEPSTSAVLDRKRLAKSESL